ncbi:transmembrane protein 205 [Limanda limanda]|uniref:transmembrane protein 205 n=1 Tax=Limanda limanda TaxID=27771 RepID=UPI0029C80EDB|nr:transmembrane protein 205 [Limanda limanda]XP_060945520.1 transmembrane protein 205 [Limanda limanda]XP_060945521.1 transmembrane protein 205 [Limanda limanda]XP_060945522.1 transmembrane protein 205 [Limanda limanda]XP_060945523.1 transmembrane protein 205 [Limanda limanda]
MATVAEPSDLIKVLHLLLLSFSWGMQVWVTFIAGFTMRRRVTLHTFGLVQSKLFPVYFHLLLGSSLLSLAVYAVFHPRELLDWHYTVQMVLFCVVPITAGLNARWLGPKVTEIMFQMREVETEQGLGNQIGRGSLKAAYDKLQEQDPKYRGFRSTFVLYHGMSSVCALIGFLSTTVILIYTALKLSTI